MCTRGLPSTISPEILSASRAEIFRRNTQQTRRKRFTLSRVFHAVQAAWNACKTSKDPSSSLHIFIWSTPYAPLLSSFLPFHFTFFVLSPRSRPFASFTPSLSSSSFIIPRVPWYSLLFPMILLARAGTRHDKILICLWIFRRLVRWIAKLLAEICSIQLSRFVLCFCAINWFKDVEFRYPDSLHTRVVWGNFIVHDV